MKNDVVKRLWPAFWPFADDSIFDDLVALADFKPDFKTYSLTQFVKKDNGYELTMDVNKEATSKNVTVTLDEENNTIEIKYTYEKENPKRHESTSVVETIPDDLDTSTLDAIVDDGVFKITAGLKEKAEDSKNVVINKK